ncbi:MAG: response regulator transcription factor, partial [Chloroflexi bacterium]|nr:response regulator transcription factor [Chloroflexota bacterium]
MQRLIRVLVVEDDTATRVLLAELLAEEGYVVDVAAHGVEALERARTALPDVVLLDVHLPFMDSGTFREALLGLDGGDRAKVLILTAGFNARETTERLHAHAYLEKPFDIGQLLATVSALAGGG